MPEVYDISGTGPTAPRPKGTGTGRPGKSGSSQTKKRKQSASPFERPYSLHHAMTELVALGVPLNEVVRMATENAAIVLGLENEMGALSVGMPADISALRVIDGDWTLVDSDSVTKKATQLIHPEFALRAGK